MPIYKTKEKRDGLSKYRVRINYIDDSGKNRSLTRIAYGLAAAKELEAKLSRNKNEQVHSNMMLQDLIELYFEFKQIDVRESTLKKAKGITYKYIYPLDIRLNKLSVRRLNEWKLSIGNLPLSHTMKKNIYGQFRSILNWAVSKEYLKSNPLNKVGNFKNPYKGKDVIQFYTPDEFKRYIVCVREIALEKGFYDYYVFFMLAYFTGARKGEIHALRWSDYKDGAITISKSISQKLSGGDRETPPKNMSSNRTLQVPEPLKRVLEQHYAQCQDFDSFNDNFYITGGYKPLRDTSIENVNKEAARRAGLHHIRIHDFRHSHASLLANNNINILEISRRLGHKNIEQTLNRYSHFYPAEQEKAVKVLDKIKI